MHKNTFCISENHSNTLMYFAYIACYMGNKLRTDYCFYSNTIHNVYKPFQKSGKEYVRQDPKPKKPVSF